MIERGTKLVIISGCSGGGKSTLLNELSLRGYATVPEAATEIVEAQFSSKGCEIPWVDKQAFSERLIQHCIEGYYRATSLLGMLENVVFFDRSLVEGIRYYQLANCVDLNKYDYLLSELRYFNRIYFAPPWEEIYCENELRKHTYKTSLRDYHHIQSFYKASGYQLSLLPKVSVKARADFLLSSLNTS